MTKKPDKQGPAKRGRPTSPKYEERVHIGASPRDVAKAIMRGPPKPKEQWRYLKDKDK